MKIHKVLSSDLKRPDLVLHSNCNDKKANSYSETDELYLNEETSNIPIKIFNQHSFSPFDNQKAVFFTSGPATSKFANFKIEDKNGVQPSYLRSFLVQTSSSAGLDGIVWESPKTEILKCAERSSSVSSDSTSNNYSQITPFTGLQFLSSKNL